MTIRDRRWVGWALAMCATAVCIGITSAAAQTRPPGPPRMHVAVASGVVSGAGLGASDADLRGRNAEPVRLFTTSSRVAASVPLEVRIGYERSPRYALEVRAAYGRPELRTAIADDAEGAPEVTVAERVHQYTLDGGVLIPLGQLRTAGSFLSVGAGYGWVVHEGFALLEHGVIFRGGGGLRYPLTTRSRWFVRGMGIRGDAALIVMTGGASLGEGVSRHLAATGGVYLRF